MVTVTKVQKCYYQKCFSGLWKEKKKWITVHYRATVHAQKVMERSAGGYKDLIAQMLFSQLIKVVPLGSLRHQGTWH